MLILYKKTFFDDKLKNLNKKVTSNKTKHVLVENELNELSEELSAKDYSFYQQTFNMLELKINKSTEYVISWK